MVTYAYRPTRLMDTYRRLFDESVVNPQLLSPEAGALRLDVAANGDEYVVTAAVPGLKADDLTVEVLGDTVTLRGELAAPEAQDGVEYLLRERRYGKFARSLTLPTEVNGAKAEAAITDGVLTLRLPKAETAKARTIKVNAK
jgi:HSP20 family protein